MMRVKNKSEFEEFLDKINECIKWFENEVSNIRKSYNLRLDNGEDLKIIFDPNNVAHLLGIDTEYLKSTGYFKGSSYEILKFICNNSYRVYNLIRDGSLSFDSFISEYALEKLNGFETICGFDLYNIEFICKYDKHKSYVTGYEQLEGDYYIAYKGKENNSLFIVGFKKNGDYLFPITNRCVDLNNDDSKSFLNILLDNQVITMITYSHFYYFNTRSQSNRVYVDYNKKNSLIGVLNAYGEEYNAIVDVSVGYKYVIEKLISQFEHNNGVVPILCYISEVMKKGDKINEVTLRKKFGNVPESIKSLVEAYNGAFCNRVEYDVDDECGMSAKSACDAESQEISKLRSELEETKMKLLFTQEELEKSQRINTEYASRERSLMRILERKVSE